MSIHQMSLQPKYYDFIAHGTKRIELRLFDEKRQKIQLGDTMEFSKSTDEILRTKVVDILRYESFEKLFEDFDIAMLADESMTKEELLAALEEFYTPEQQEKYGVVGLRVELTDL